MQRVEGSREGWTGSSDQGSKGDGLEFIFHSREEQDRLREKATLMVHHEDVQEMQEETYISD